MRIHRHVSRKIRPGHPLWDKTVHIPAMAEGSVEALAAVFRWLGIDAVPTPPSNDRTLELGGKYTSGDECYPAKVTTGDFLRIIEQPGFDPKRSVFFMATANGPCRFGQYAPFLKKVLTQAGHAEVEILSPRTETGYNELGELGGAFKRAAWRGLVCGDLLRKCLLKTRPYEIESGVVDRIFAESLVDLCHTLEHSCGDPGCQLRSLVACMVRGRDRFRRAPVRYDRDVPLIGVVGEIFCRLNNFSNDNLIRKLENYGGEAWMTDISEWIAYTNSEEARKLRLRGRALTLEMLGSKVRSHFQHADERALLEPFREDFKGYEEAACIHEILELARPYLPCSGVEGEMVLSIGKAAYLARHGADGIVDISPFTCMNGIVSEAIYPKLSRDYGGIPIRNFYFDGTQSDLDRDVGIYMELARSYMSKKQYPRTYPGYFAPAALASD
jgi:predicted nucleotide-binding protein (sugar kinase/HSP70/actin superfamily)